jgi:hypothetical protein
MFQRQNICANLRSSADKLFGTNEAAHPNDVARFTLAEVMVQFQRKKLLAISFYSCLRRE